MNPIAIFYNNISIYYSQLIVLAAIVAALVTSLALFSAKQKNLLPMFIYCLLSIPLSLFLSRALHWYCNMESYKSFAAAVSDYGTGDFCISGVLLGVWLPAMLLQITKLVKHRSQFLSSVAPGLAFVIAMVRFSHIFNTTCRGKIVIENPSLQHLPLASAVDFGDGKVTYQLASFFLSFIFILLLAIFLLLYELFDFGKKNRTDLDQSKYIYKLFLVLFSAQEVILDSTRNDASHLFFSGEMFQAINKGTSFVGLSQAVSACILAFLWATSLSKADKKPLRISFFLVGLILAGGCEYLVQRFSGLYIPIYSGQIAGLVLMIISIL